MLNENTALLSREFNRIKAEVREMEEQLIRAMIRGATHEEVKILKDNIEKHKRTRDYYSQEMMNSLSRKG